mmetsp:Transcript_4660/g.13294  ORF Transcript_4660/g.13294 Transcript_4660/m.13294 type:complete len:204 (-) Transcript_4660:2817-3428(-)
MEVAMQSVLTSPTVPDDPILLVRLLVHVPPDNADDMVGLCRRLEFLVDTACVGIQSLRGVNLATDGTSREHLGLDHLPAAHTPVLRRVHALVRLDRLASHHRAWPARVALVQLVALLVDGLVRIAGLAGNTALLGVRIDEPIPSPEARPSLSTVNYILHAEQRWSRKLGRGVVLNRPPVGHGRRGPVRPAASAIHWNVLVPHR